MRLLFAACTGLVLTLAAALLPPLSGAARAVELRLRDEHARRLELGRSPAFAPIAAGWLERLPAPRAAPTPGEAAVEALLRAAGGGLLLGVILYAMTIRPLRLLEQAARRVADGDVSVRMAPGPPNELGLLGRYFNRMTGRLALKARERDDFLAKMAHDLRSPLSAVLQHADALRADALGPFAQTLDELKGEGRRLVEQIEDVLELARLESRAARPTLDPVDLRTELALALERRGPENPPVFSLHAIPGAARVRADTLALGPALDQVFVVARAWAAASEPATISVYRGKPNEVVVAVGFSTRQATQAVLAALPARPQERSAGAPVAGIDEVRWLRAARLLESAGGTLELKAHDDGSWSLLASLREA